MESDLPMEEVAQRMVSSCNAFYKMVYDARQRLLNCRRSTASACKTCSLPPRMSRGKVWRSCSICKVWMDLAIDENEQKTKMKLTRSSLKQLLQGVPALRPNKSAATAVGMCWTVLPSWN